MYVRRGRSADFLPKGISISLAIPSMPIRVNATRVTSGTVFQLSHVIVRQVDQLQNDVLDLLHVVN